MNNLYIAFLQENIKPEQVAKVIAQLLDCSERTVRNKLNGISDFTISEAVKINAYFFNDRYELGYLFKREDSYEKRGGYHACKDL